jgi:hypothetical protein
MSTITPKLGERQDDPVVEITVLLNGQQVAVGPARVASAVHALIERGERGVTPLEWVGPRWSDYVLKAKKLGFDIETVHEGHSGPFAGRHGRYVMRSPVQVLKVVRASEARRAAEAGDAKKGARDEA